MLLSVFKGRYTYDSGVTLKYMYRWPESDAIAVQVLWYLKSLRMLSELANAVVASTEKNISLASKC